MADEPTETDSKNETVMELLPTCTATRNRRMVTHDQPPRHFR